MVITSHSLFVTVAVFILFYFTVISDRYTDEIIKFKENMFIIAIVKHFVEKRLILERVFFL